MPEIRILVSSDVHANLPAAEELIHLGRDEGCDLHIHTGDAVDIGPWPRETVEVFRNAGVLMLMGNHEEYCTGLREPGNNLPMAERDHYRWTRSRMHPGDLEFLAGLPYQYRPEWGPHRICFQHFCLSGSRISPVNVFLPGKAPDWDALFHQDDDLVIFGHIHNLVDMQARSRYLSFGASGCLGRYFPNRKALIMDISTDRIRLTHRDLTWDPGAVLRELEVRNVPDRDTIKRNFFDHA